MIKMTRKILFPIMLAPCLASNIVQADSGGGGFVPQLELETILVLGAKAHLDDYKPTQEYLDSQARTPVYGSFEQKKIMIRGIDEPVLIVNNGIAVYRSGQPERSNLILVAVGDTQERTDVEPITVLSRDVGDDAEFNAVYAAWQKERWSFGNVLLDYAFMKFDSSSEERQDIWEKSLDNDLEAYQY